MGGKVIWITGLPGSGKSTVADALKEIHPSFVLMRMDEFRKIVTPCPTYSDAERDIVYRGLVYLARELAALGHDVIIDATGNRRKWRDLAREIIPGFIEAYLRCPLEVCMKREEERRETHAAPRDIYKKGAEGWPVPGLTVPYEEPLNPEILIETDICSTGDAVLSIDNFLEKRPRESCSKKKGETDANR
jgi:adenylylsulfate kinase